MKESYKKEEKKPNWQEKSKEQYNPSQPTQPNRPLQTPGKKPHGGCGC